MQIVIDIPEDVYTRLFDPGIEDNEIAIDDICVMASAVRLGKPLPKLPKEHEMREATPEELESVNNYIKSISKPTGVNFWDIV